MKLVPVCPVCNEEMIVKLYDGYYDNFHYWACKCSNGKLQECVEEVYYGAFTIGIDRETKNSPKKIKK